MTLQLILSGLSKSRSDGINNVTKRKSRVHRRLYSCEVIWNHLVQPLCWQILHPMLWNQNALVGNVEQGTMEQDVATSWQAPFQLAYWSSINLKVCSFGIQWGLFKKIVSWSKTEYGGRNRSPYSYCFPMESSWLNSVASTHPSLEVVKGCDKWFTFCFFGTCTTSWVSEWCVSERRKRTSQEQKCRCHLQLWVVNWKMQW